MLKLAQNDFIPMDRFALRWRWTDAEHRRLPAGRLALIHPLAATKAAELDSLVRLVDDSVSSTNMMLASSHEANVREWLATTLPAGDVALLVSWDRLTAVQTPLPLFVEYWNDFCYPSSDDVKVVPLTGDWLLRYSHEEILRFWKLPPLARQVAGPGVAPGGPSL